MKKLLSVAFVTGSFTLGYSTAISQAMNRPLLEAALKEGNSSVQVADLQAGRSLAYAMEVVAGEMTDGNGNSAVERELDRVKLSAHEEALWKALGDDGVGARVRRVLVSERHAQDLPGAKLVSKKWSDEVHKNPEAGTTEIAQALERIPSSGFAEERESLFQTLGEIGGPAETVKTLALNELLEHPAPARPDPTTVVSQEDLDQAMSTTSETNLPVTVHQIFLRHTADPHEALTGTVSGVVAQTDAGVRISLASQFVRLYPELRNDLISAIRDHGIEPPIDSNPI